MAKLKFFRLGLTKAVSYSTYDNCKLTDASNGGIIFAKVKNNDNIELYIWANGIEYNVLDVSLFDNISNKVYSMDVSINDILNEVEEIKSAYVSTISTNSINSYINLDISVNENDYILDISTKIVNLFDDVSQEENDGFVLASNIKEYIDSSISEINNDIDIINSSISVLNNFIDDISAKIPDTIVTSVSTNTKFVNIDSSINDVIINLDIIDASDPTFQNIDNNGIVTAGYVEEKLDRFNWVEINE